MSIKVVLTCVPYSNHVYAPPLQLAYLKAYLQQDRDIEVKTLDSEAFFFRSNIINNNVQSYIENIWEPPRTFNNEIKRVLDGIADMLAKEHPAVVGFSVSTGNSLFTRYVSQRIKEKNPRIFIVYGGLAFSLRQSWDFQVAVWHKDFRDVDCVVKGEGEVTLMELVKSVKEGKTLQYCQGATIRNGGQIKDCGSRPLITNIDTLPFPDFSNFPRRDYLSDYIRILFFRGCVGKCVFCGENYTMGTIRCRSARNIINEIKLRLSQGYRRFQSCDFALNSNISCLKEVCQLIIKEKLDIEFVFSQFKHSPNLTRKIFALLRKTGFAMVTFGTESASQRILNKMEKGVDVKTIEQNIRNAYREGIKVSLYLMVGFPGENEDTFMETVHFIKKNAKYLSAIDHISPVAVNWGSRIHDNISQYDLEESTLFNELGTWRTADGKNTLEWRYSLKERMQRYLQELGVPTVDYREDGNPKIIGSPGAITDSKKEVERIKAVLLEADNYSAIFMSIGKDMVNTQSIVTYVLRIKNTGNVKWGKIFETDYNNTTDNWIRVGCRVHNELKNNTKVIMELRQELPKDIIQGEEFQVHFNIDIASLTRNTKYRLEFGMVNEHKFWFEDSSSAPLIEYIEL